MTDPIARSPRAQSPVLGRVHNDPAESSAVPDCSALLTSTVVGEWKDPARQLCNPEPPDPCDCGFVGDWPYRWVMVWHDEPHHRAGDLMKRRWLAKGWPVLDGGWWVIGGMDERCPGCGDIERFDMEHERIRQFEERARVLTLAKHSDEPPAPST